MTVFGRWWKAPDTPNANPADYDIYPVHLMDGAKVNHKVMGWTMRFNDVLDADILHNSIMTLLDIGDWRKLAGRLKRNVSRNINLLLDTLLLLKSSSVLRQTSLIRINRQKDSWKFTSQSNLPKMLQPFNTSTRPSSATKALITTPSAVFSSHQLTNHRFKSFQSRYAILWPQTAIQRR